jgi:hypothetical protein
VGEGRRWPGLPRSNSGAKLVTSDRARRASALPSGKRRGRRALVLFPILALAVLFYYWTGTTNGTPIRFGKQSDYYNRLANAFLRGHLSLLTKPPKALLALKDPYNPVANARWQTQYHDLALYHGHFYLTWGPTPIVTLLLPWRLLHLGAMPVSLAAVIFCSLGLLFSVALLCFLVDRYFPRAKAWQLAFATGALAFSNVAPFMLRRPDVYELAISSGYCFAMLGAFLIASGSLGTHTRPWRLGIGSLSIGLAVGGRPSLVFEALFLLVVFVYLIRREGSRDWMRRTKLAVLIFGPVVAVLFVLFAYNEARFGSFLQYGAKYQLAALELSKDPYFRVSYLPPGLWYYMLAPARWTLAFPYFTLPPPPAYPGVLPLHYSTEISGGLLTTTPIVVGLLPGALLVYRERRLELGLVMLSSVAVGALILVFVSVALAGSTMRYEADFAPFFILPALLAWFVLMRGKGRRFIATIGAIAIAYGCIVGVAISLYGYSDQLRTTDPGTYWALDRATSFIPTLAAKIVGHPVIVRVVSPALGFGNSGTYDIGTTRFVLYPEILIEVDVIAPSAGKSILKGNLYRTRSDGTARVTMTIRLRSQEHSLSVGEQELRIPVSLEPGLNRIKMLAQAPGIGPFSPVAVINRLDLSRQIAPR